MSSGLGGVWQLAAVIAGLAVGISVSVGYFQILRIAGTRANMVDMTTDQFAIVQ